MRDLNTDIPGQLFGLLTTQTIIACALLEGAIFFLLVATLTENSFPSIIFAGFLWLLLITHFPTRNWVNQWLENQERLLQEELSLKCW